jgi:hypothetical protein
VLRSWGPNTLIAMNDFARGAFFRFSSASKPGIFKGPSPTHVWGVLPESTRYIYLLSLEIHQLRK